MSGRVEDSRRPAGYLEPPLVVSQTAESQLEFLGKIERLLSEGLFTATYKYALLTALVDLAIERGDDTGAELTLPIGAIAEKFITMYWRQALPYSAEVAGARAAVLHQNTGRQAAAITMLCKLQERGSSLTDLRRDRAWPGLLRKVTSLVKVMPLWKLQTVGNERLEFLYRAGTESGTITLQPGVAANLRRFAPLVRRLAQSEWLRFVQRLQQNQPILGRATNLAAFLFGEERQALTSIRSDLLEIQSGSCFYCDRRIRRDGVVDHFIPWSRYPRDLAHNFVVAHASCNSEKRDYLAGESFLERWCERTRNQAEPVGEIGARAGFLVDADTSLSVARWSYEHASQIHAQVWLGGGVYGHLSGAWRVMLGA